MINTNHIFLLTILSFISLPSLVQAQSGAIEITEIILTNDVQIGGTLTLPKNNHTKSLVIMLSGSGPQDRDETLDGFKIFKELSGRLAERGIPTFRFDDRGVGKSTGDFPSSTLENHASDVRAIINYFKTHQQHKFNKFILLGHSQGGIVSANVAIGNEDVEKVVLMGAPSVPLVEIVLYQLRQEYKGTNVPSELIEHEVSAHNRLMNAMTLKQNIEQALIEFKSASIAISSMMNSSQKSVAEIESLSNDKTKEFEVIYSLPSLTSFLYHDTAKDYASLNVPVLALFGTKDLQVTIAQNKDRMELALLKSKSTYHFATFKNANHYFQKAKTGQREEYATLDKKFINGFIDTISGWILNH